MYNQLTEKLKAYITINNPDLFIKLDSEFKLTAYLEEKVSSAMPLLLDLLAADKPGHAIAELVMEAMTAELKPSRYNYILALIEERFSSHYASLKEIGMLQYVTLQILERCDEVFNRENFRERNKDSAWLRSLVALKIRDYFTK